METMKILVILALLGLSSAHLQKAYDSSLSSFQGSSGSRYYGSSPSYGTYSPVASNSYRSNYYRPSIRPHNGRFIGATTPAPAYNYATTPSSVFRPSAYHVTTPSPLNQYAVTTSTPSYYQGSSYSSTPSYYQTPSYSSTPSYYQTPSYSSTPSYYQSQSYSSTPSYYQTPSYSSTPSYYSSSNSYVTPSPINSYTRPFSSNSYNHGTSSFGSGYTIAPAILAHHSSQSYYPHNTGTYNPSNVLAGSSPYNRYGGSYSQFRPSNIVVSNYGHI